MKITPRAHGFLPLLMFLLGFVGTPAWAVTTTASDTFPNIAYNGSDGTAPWGGDWQEFGESATAPIYSTGQVRVLANSTTAGVTNCVASNCVRIGGNQVEIQNHGLLRQIDLSGATSATLRFTRRFVRPSSTLTTGLGAVRVEVSSDGGATWQLLPNARYPFTTTTDPQRTAVSFDITSWASVNTRIRFIGEATNNRPLDSVGFFYVDDVKVDVVRPDVPPPPPSVGLSVRDSFAAVAYNGSDGVAPNTNPGPWTNPWIEIGETGAAAGPTTGQVRVVTNANCAATSCFRLGANGPVNIANRGASRAVNLGGNLVTARLSLLYRRVINTPPTGSGSVLVQASPNGTTWTTLMTIPFGAASDAGQLSADIDIKPYAAAGFQFRFLGQGTTANGLLHVDNVQVAWTINNPPTAANDSYTATQNTALTIAAPGVLANDTDPEGGALTAAAVTQPGHGSLTLNRNGSFTYTPQTNYNGPDSFTYVANDGLNNSPAVTVNITVTAVNQPPAFTGTPYTFNVNGNAAVGTTVGPVSATDPEGGAVTYSITAGNTGNAFAINASTGAITVATAPLTVGTVNLTVSATDNLGLSAQPPATVTITVVNQPPVFNPTSYNFTVKQTAATGAAVGTVSATDPEAGTVTYSITAGNTGNKFAINASTGAITVAAPFTAAGTFNLTVSATDPSGAHAEVPVTVTVTEVTVNLKLLVIATGNATTDGAFDYIQRFLEQAGVPYDVFDASAATTLTSGTLTDPLNPSHGLYNGIILTDTTVGLQFAPSEWTALHNYERDFKVREAVLSGWPAYSWNPATGCVSPTFSNCDYDYGMVDSSWESHLGSAAPINGQWSTSAPGFTYINKSNPWTITDFAWYATPRNDATVTATPLLTEQGTGKALISRLTYPDGREVLLSSISNAWFLLYSDALAREFVNFATKGVFIGESKAYLNIHVDDLFLGDNLWDPVANWTSADLFARLLGAEVSNVATAQSNFRTAHPLANNVQVEFAFNGVGTGVNTGDATCTALANTYLTGISATAPTADQLADSMSAIQANQANFGFINHSYTHLDMDYSRNTDLAGSIAGASTVADYQNQINCNRLVWSALQLPGYNDPNNSTMTMVTGEHSSIKDDGWHDDAGTTYCYADSYLGSHCVTEALAPFPEPPLNVLLNDPSKAFPYSGNPRFFETAQNNLGLRYLASDASQVNQAVEQFVTNVPTNRILGATPTENFNLVLLPRYPTNVFYNVSYPGALVDCSTQPNPPTDPNCQPGSLVDEYNNLFRERPFAQNGNVEYCVNGIPPANSPYSGDICAPRDYATILTAEADTAVRHMLSWQKYPHFFHEINLKNYDGTGSTLLSDWLNSVMVVYESYMNLPVKSLPYWQVGQLTEQRLNARGAGITGVWNVTLGTVTLQATTPPATGTVNAIVTGVAGSEPLYGGQSIQTIGLTGTSPVTVPVSP